MTELPKAYNPAESESKPYSYWYEHKLFDAEIDPSRSIGQGRGPFPEVTPVKKLEQGAPR